MIVHNGKVYNNFIEVEDKQETILEACKLLIENGLKPVWIIMNERQYATIYYNN